MVVHKGFDWVFRNPGPISAPWQLKLGLQVLHVPGVRRALAYAIGVGVRPEHVHDVAPPVRRRKIVPAWVDTAQGSWFGVPISYLSLACTVDGSDRLRGLVQGGSLWPGRIQGSVMEQRPSVAVSFRIPHIVRLLALLFVLPMCVECAGQIQRDIPVRGASESLPEMISRGEAVTFKVKVNLVMVPVVVRDSKGRPIGNLRAEDFVLLDMGKPQPIKSFEAITPSARAERTRIAAEQNPGKAAATAALPRRFVAYVFDDVHLRFEDLAQTRAALDRQLALLKPTDRAALYTPTGSHMLEFTDDMAKLRQELFRLTPSGSPDLGVLP